MNEQANELNSDQNAAFPPLYDNETDENALLFFTEGGGKREEKKPVDYDFTENDYYL